MSSDRNAHRLVNVIIDPRILDRLFFAGPPGVYHRTDRGLPFDAELVGQSFDWSRRAFVLTYRHESFAEVPVGDQLPQFDAFGLSAICLPSPMDGATVAMLDGLVNQQIARQLEAAPDDVTPIVCGG